MFEKELEIKRTVLENVAHTDSRDLLMTYSACWVHEPFIAKDKEFLIDSMLREVGLT